MFSMTGYGKAVKEEEGRKLSVELKAVNHRFLDLNIKMPRILNPCEDAVRKIISENVSRGHIDVYLNYSDNSDKLKQVRVDIGLADGYLKAAAELEDKFFIDNNFSLAELMKMPDVLKTEAEEEDETLLTHIVSEAVRSACDNLNAMRRFEGEKIKENLSRRIDNVEKFAVTIKDAAPSVTKEYADKLKERISEMLGDVQYDEARFLNEVAFFADKCNIDEEISRLFAHIAHFRSIIAEDNAAGKQLDFLVQELNRETNTICSKSNSAELTSVALSLKNEIEKIREQVQNAE